MLGKYVFWILCITEDREICDPIFYHDYSEAYAKLTDLLVSSIIDKCLNEEYLDEYQNIVNINEASTKGLFNITAANSEANCTAMWSNVNSDYPLDAKIFRIETYAMKGELL